MQAENFPAGNDAHFNFYNEGVFFQATSTEGTVTGHNFTKDLATKSSTFHIEYTPDLTVADVSLEINLSNLFLTGMTSS